MASFISLSERIDAAFRLSVPYILMAALFTLDVVALPFSMKGVLKAPLLLMAVYYWAIYRPTLVPVWFVFVMGFLMDLLSGTALGLNALIFVLTQWAVLRQRRFLMGQPFIMIWVGFAAISALALFIQWFVMGLMQFQWLTVLYQWPSVLFGVALFPLVCIVLHMIHKILPAPHPAMRFGTQS